MAWDKIIIKEAWWKEMVLFTCITCFYFGSLQYSIIYDETEGQYAGAVKEMMERSDYFIPTNNGLPRLQKPLFTYWCMILANKGYHDQEIAMRMPYIFALLGWFAATYLLTKEILSRKEARIATALLASSLGVVVFGRMIMPEPFLACFITATLYCFVCALKEDRKAQRWWILVWFFMGLGCFAKGLHGAAWPLTIMILTCVFDREKQKQLLGLISWPGIGLFILMTIPWYLFIESCYPGFLQENLWNEQIGHALDFRDPPTYQRVALWIFLVQHLFLILPSILFLPAAMIHWKKQASPFPSKLLFFWILVILLTTCFSARQDYYTMSMWSAVCILVAPVFLQKHQRSRWPLAFPIATLILGGILCFVGAFLQTNPQTHTSSFRGDASDQFLSVMLTLPSATQHEFTQLMLIAGTTLLVGNGFALFLLLRKKHIVLWPVIILAMIGPLYGAIKGYYLMGDYFSLKNTATIIQSNLKTKPNSIIVYDGPLNLCSSLLFYLKPPIYLVNTPWDAEFAVRVLKQGREQYLSKNDLLHKWKMPNHIFLICHQQDQLTWQNRLGDTYEISSARSGERILLSNHKLE